MCERTLSKANLFAVQQSCHCPWPLIHDCMSLRKHLRDVSALRKVGHTSCLVAGTRDLLSLTSTQILPSSTAHMPDVPVNHTLTLGRCISRCTGATTNSRWTVADSCSRRSPRPPAPPACAPPVEPRFPGCVPDRLHRPCSSTWCKAAAAHCSQPNDWSSVFSCSGKLRLRGGLELTGQRGWQ